MYCIQNYQLHISGFKPQWRQDFLDPSTLAPMPTPPPVQWVPGLFWEVKQQGIVPTAHPPSSAGVEYR